MKKPHRFKSHCPINYAQEIFGDRWSLLIIRDLMFKQKKYYGEFLKSDEKIATNILASRLDKLENMGLIHKHPDPDNGAKILYGLTPKGLDLLPLLLEMIAWSARHDPETEAPESFIRRLKNDREALMAEILKQLS